MSFERKGKKCETLFGWACHLSDCWEERFSQKCHRPFGVVFSNGRSCNVECWPVRNAAAIGRFDLFQTTHSSQIFFSEECKPPDSFAPWEWLPLAPNKSPTRLHEFKNWIYQAVKIFPPPNHVLFSHDFLVVNLKLRNKWCRCLRTIGALKSKNDSSTISFCQLFLYANFVTTLGWHQNNIYNMV